MGELKVMELFSGIGAFTKGLTNIGVNYDLVGFSEIDKPAIKSYCGIHNVTEELNLGDISKIRTDYLPDTDLMTYSFPCQSISKAGKLGGYSEGSGTESSLLWEAMRVASVKKPKYLLAENVPNLLSKKFKVDFNKWIQLLYQLGYNTYFTRLNATRFWIPQNRDRVFVLSIRKDIDTGNFKFPTGTDLTTRLLDLLETNVDEKYYISDEEQMKLTYKMDGNRIFIKNATKLGYLEAFHGDGIDLGYPNSETRRGRVQPQRSQTLTTSDNLGVLIGDRIRRFTPLESIRLMGFSDEDYRRIKETGATDRQIYKLAGNSIVVNVVEGIFKELFKDKLINKKEMIL